MEAPGAPPSSRERLRHLHDSGIVEGKIIIEKWSASSTLFAAVALFVYSLPYIICAKYSERLDHTLRPIMSIFIMLSIVTKFPSPYKSRLSLRVSQGTLEVLKMDLVVLDVINPSFSLSVLQRMAQSDYPNRLY